MCTYLFRLWKPNIIPKFHVSPQIPLLSLSSTLILLVFTAVSHFHSRILHFTLILLLSLSNPLIILILTYSFPTCVIRPLVKLSKQLSNYRFWFILISKEYYTFLPLRHFFKPFSLDCFHWHKAGSLHLPPRLFQCVSKRSLCFPLFSLPI